MFICWFWKDREKKKSSFVSVAKARFLWRISYGGEATPRQSCAKDKVRQEKPSSPTPSRQKAHRNVVSIMAGNGSFYCFNCCSPCPTHPRRRWLLQPLYSPHSR